MGFSPRALRLRVNRYRGFACSKDVRRGVRRRDRGQRPTATKDPNTKQLRRSVYFPTRANGLTGLARDCERLRAMSRSQVWSGTAEGWGTGDLGLAAAAAVAGFGFEHFLLGFGGQAAGG